MFKNYYLLIITVSILMNTACKELYNPEVQNTEKVLVIEGLMTNHPGESYVKLQYAVPYDTVDNALPVVDASVSVWDDLGNEYILKTDSTNSYKNNSLYAEQGRIYHLRITTAEGLVYESDTTSLPQAYNQDSIYADNVVKQTLEENSTGGYYKVITKGIETFSDFSSGTTDIPKCRFDIKITIMYNYIIYPKTGPTVTMYCWKTFNPNENINLTSSNYEKTTGKINEHSLGFFKTDIYSYDTRNELNFFLSGYLLTEKKYNLDKNSFQYYTDLKKQLEATGKIFDPLASQLNGNIHCSNNQNKLCFGYFELSNTEVKYYRYTNSAKIRLNKWNKDSTWTREGETNLMPTFWQ